MDYIIQNISPSASVLLLKMKIQTAISKVTDRDFSVEVSLGRSCSGEGRLILSDFEVGERFAALFSGQDPLEEIIVSDNALLFHRSPLKAPSIRIMDSAENGMATAGPRNHRYHPGYSRRTTINTNPLASRPRIGARKVALRNPHTLSLTTPKLRRAITDGLPKRSIPIDSLYFGWECRDGVFSAEYEAPEVPGRSFNADPNRPNFEVSLGDGLYIVIPLARIRNIYLDDTKSAVYFMLTSAWSYESNSTEYDTHNRPRNRLSHLPYEDHDHFSPFTSSALRLSFSSPDALSDFVLICWTFSLRHSPFEYHTDYFRHCFSKEDCLLFSRWLATLDFQVAYQIEALVNDGLIGANHAFDLATQISELISERGTAYTAAYLTHFGTKLKQMNEPTRVSTSTLFEEHRTSFSGCGPNTFQSNTAYFECRRIKVTPTRILLEGPFPERSNRIIRSYPNHHHCFLRVVYVDEGGSKYDPHGDRAVDGAGFTTARFGKVQDEGLVIAGKHFEFLCYSLSALKEHTVWFVTPFTNQETGQCVTTASIIAGIGTFHNLPKDPRLMYCPARYGARISQVCTSTDAVLELEPEEILFIPDIERNGSCFTDGVGTISSELAHELWKGMPTNPETNEVPPKAVQIRIMGCKGMVSVDHKMRGRTMCIRDSMIKFDAPNTLQVEVATVFNKPKRMFLNRPLIMMLEGLGVPAQVFLDLQEEALQQVEQALVSLRLTFKMLETFRNGDAFRVYSYFRYLKRAGLKTALSDTFLHNMVQIAVHDIKRSIKHRSRIPVQGWNLVGVADVHSYLEEGEVFVCVKAGKHPPVYLEGPVMVTRSPCIHPGDVQVARAIGKPPPDSPFAHEPLENTVVFSTKGERSLPSCLGGGDLDGDIYSVTDYAPLLQFEPQLPASYEPVKRKEQDFPSTKHDVADFVIDYINSDVVGIIASNWLYIADYSQQSIFDEDCKKLAQLHNVAVDYQKSGNPVPREVIPQPKVTVRPDWSAPEIVASPSRYYKSQSALGLLFREIDISIPPDLEVNDHVGAFLEDCMDVVHGPDNALYDMVKGMAKRHLDLNYLAFDHQCHATDLFKWYKSRLHQICDSSSFSPHSKPLSEEEVVMCVILENAPTKASRKEATAVLRKKTHELVQTVQSAFESAAGGSCLDFLSVTWIAFETASQQANLKIFGARSMQILCSGLVLGAVWSLDEQKSPNTWN